MMTSQLLETLTKTKNTPPEEKSSSLTSSISTPTTTLSTLIKEALTKLIELEKSVDPRSILFGEEKDILQEEDTSREKYILSLFEQGEFCLKERVRDPEKLFECFNKLHDILQRLHRKYFNGGKPAGEVLKILGLLYQGGYGVFQDLKKAQKFFSDAKEFGITLTSEIPRTADSKLADDLFHLGVTEQRKEDAENQESAYPYFLVAAQLGHSSSRYYLVNFYFGSELVEDFIESLKPNQNEPEAAWLIATYHIKASSENKTYIVPDTAIEYLKTAARGGFGMAQYWLAYYWKERDKQSEFEKSARAAFRSLEEAASKRNPPPEVLSHLAHCLRTGFGTTPNELKAQEYYKLAYENGSVSGYMSEVTLKNTEQTFSTETATSSCIRFGVDSTNKLYSYPCTSSASTTTTSSPFTRSSPDPIDDSFFTPLFTFYRNPPEPIGNTEITSFSTQATQASSASSHFTEDLTPANPSQPNSLFTTDAKEPSSSTTLTIDPSLAELAGAEEAGIKAISL